MHPSIEQVLEAYPRDYRTILCAQLLQIELRHRVSHGESPSSADYVRLLSEYGDTVREVLAEFSVAFEASSLHAGVDFDTVIAADGDASPRNESKSGLPLDSVRGTSGFAEKGTEGHPDRIGRYRVDSVLGESGFGPVFRGYDEQLHRPVAIKVSHDRHVAVARTVEAYLPIITVLHHPNIVPFFDIGSTSEGRLFQVSRLIDGVNLARHGLSHRLSYMDVVRIVATTADALHFAHLYDVVHRYVKPGNILIDVSGNVYLADFYLVSREQKIEELSDFVGTTAYTSPEQARGDGHRIDWRSDIFSLGVVFYELLSGRRPFGGSNAGQQLQRICNEEARPLRQIDDTIPRELERICLRALAKRAIDRYSTAQDFSEELRCWMEAAPRTVSGAAESVRLVPRPASPSPDVPALPDAAIVTS